MAMCCSRLEHRTGRSVTPPVAPRSAHSIVCCVCGPQVQHRPKAGRRRQSVLERNLAICSGRFARLRLARGGSRERAGVRARGARVARGWRTSFALGFALRQPEELFTIEAEELFTPDTPHPGSASQTKYVSSPHKYMHRQSYSGTPSLILRDPCAIPPSTSLH